MDIFTVADMQLFRDRVNSGRTYEGKTVRLMADIDLNEGKYTVSENGTVTFNSNAVQWELISKLEVNKTQYFKGIFEGNKHEIKGIYINGSTNSLGLFGINDGNIQNITIKGSIINSKTYTGAIAGTNRNTISNCCNNSYVRGYHSVGGITGLGGYYTTYI